VVEAGVGELPRGLQVAPRVGAAGGRLADVVGVTNAVAASKLTGLGSSDMTFQPVGPKRIRRCADSTAVASSGAQANGTSP
jgi:hypothetical protein